jgi:multisubunit Na+/H+ antiporter MnhF subunit
MTTFIEILFYAGWVLAFLVVLAGVYRLVAGPSTLDRLVGFDTLTASVVGLIVIVSIHQNTADYMELILIITGLGFFTTVAFYYYLCQPKQRSGEDFNHEHGGES